MANQDLFAPPTAEEMSALKKQNDDLFAPPSDEEISALRPPEKSMKQKFLDYQLPFGTTPRGFIKGTAEALPTAGMIGGGLLGGAAGLGIGSAPGAVAGAAGGGALGYAGKNAIESLLLDEAKDRKDVYLDPVKGAIEGAGAEMGGQLLSKGAQAVADSPVGKWVGDKATKAIGKIGETFTGVSPKETETYLKNSDAVKQMAKSSDNNTFLAADDMRDEWGKRIWEKKGELNKVIDSTLSGSNKNVDLSPVVSSLEQTKAGLDPNLHPEKIKEIENILTRVKNTTASGPVPVSKANEIKGMLQEFADSAYESNPIMKLSDDSALAAKSAAAKTRGIIDIAEPKVTEANSGLANFHDIRNSMNRNILKSGQPESAILAAGSGGNPRNAEALTRLGEATGSDFLGDAEKLAAMRTFGSPKFTAADHNGKALARHGLGFLTGGYIGGHEGGAQGAITGAAIGGAITSPAALKFAIDSGHLTAKMLSEPMVQNALGQGLIKQAAEYMMKKPGLLQDDDQLGKDRLGSK